MSHYIITCPECGTDELYMPLDRPTYLWARVLYWGDDGHPAAISTRVRREDLPTDRPIDPCDIYCTRGHFVGIGPLEVGAPVEAPAYETLWAGRECPECSGPLVPFETPDGRDAVATCPACARAYELQVYDSTDVWWREEVPVYDDPWEIELEELLQHHNRQVRLQARLLVPEWKPDPPETGKRKGHSR